MGAVDDGVGCGQLPLAVLRVAREVRADPGPNLAKPVRDSGARLQFHGCFRDEGGRCRVGSSSRVVVLLDGDTGLLEVGSDLVVERDELDELVTQMTVAFAVLRECDARKKVLFLVDVLEGVDGSEVVPQGPLAVVVERRHLCDRSGSHGGGIEDLLGHHDLLSEGCRLCIDARYGVALMKEATQ